MQIIILVQLKASFTAAVEMKTQHSFFQKLRGKRKKRGGNANRCLKDNANYVIVSVSATDIIAMSWSTDTQGSESKMRTACAPLLYCFTSCVVWSLSLSRTRQRTIRHCQMRSLAHNFTTIFFSFTVQS